MPEVESDRFAIPSMPSPVGFPLVDANAGVGHWPFRRLSRTNPASLLGHLRRLGVQRVVLSSNAAAWYRDPSEADAELLRLRRERPDTVAAVVTISPVLPEWGRDLERALGEGAAGVRLLPHYQGFELLSGPVLELVSALADRRVPVVLPLRLEDERHQHPACVVRPLTPESILRWIERLPNRPPIVLGTGRFEEWKKVGAALKPEDDVYLDLSFVNGPDGAIEELVSLVSAERLLFGTRAPFAYAYPKVEQLLSADISPEERRAIGAGNALRLFFRSHGEGIGLPPLNLPVEG